MMSFSYRAKLSKKLNKCTYRPIWSEFCADPIDKKAKKLKRKRVNKYIGIYIYTYIFFLSTRQKNEKVC